MTIDYLATAAGIPVDLAVAVYETCEACGIIGSDGAVLDLELTRTHLDELFRSRNFDLEAQNWLFAEKKSRIFDVILRSRYRNVYGLLQDQITEDDYLGIVRNQILVDVQGSDVLYQIFTCNVLQREQGEEAPFLEFIQRVCSDSKGRGFKPGCGGFGYVFS